MHEIATHRFFAALPQSGAWSHGFTLIELLFTLAILATLAPL
jgi:prepilin-type N-terminal cleavage/methylation domain-containing protein